MSQILIYFLIAISLSMDAFSVAISLGTIAQNNRNIIKTGLSVGIFHLFMPILGSCLAQIINERVNLRINQFTALIFLILALEMYFNKETENKINILNIITIIIVSFTVSIDSFSVGIALALNKENIFIPSIIFSITSTIFTIIGLLLGKKIQKKYNRTATYIGIIIMLLVSIKYLLI